MVKFNYSERTTKADIPASLSLGLHNFVECSSIQSSSSTKAGFIDNLEIVDLSNDFSFLQDLRLIMWPSSMKESLSSKLEVQDLYLEANSCCPFLATISVCEIPLFCCKITHATVNRYKEKHVPCTNRYAC